jgi:ribosomal protein L11 methyltransferase
MCRIKLNAIYPKQLHPFQADIVLANILAKPLIDMSEQICALLVSGGQLVLSGILREQAESVISAYQQNINFNPLIQQEDWIRLDGVKR